LAREALPAAEAKRRSFFCSNTGHHFHSAILGLAAGEWADFFGHRGLRDLLLNEGPICLFDALDHDRTDRVKIVLARDPAALVRLFAQYLSRDPHPKD
jgi:hypothetical protein